MIAFPTKLQVRQHLAHQIGHHARELRLQRFCGLVEILQELFVTGLVSVDDVCHHLDRNQRQIGMIGDVSDDRHLHLLHGGIMLLHDFVILEQRLRQGEVQTTEVTESAHPVRGIQRVARGHHPALQSQVSNQLQTFRSATKTNAIGVEARDGDPAIVMHKGRADVAIPNATAHALEPACCTRAQNNVRVEVVDQQKCGQGS